MLAFIAPYFPPLLPIETAVGSLSLCLNEIIAAGAITPWTDFSVEEKTKVYSRKAKDLLKFVLSVPFRIAGDTALNKNIHESVSAQIRKNFAKSKWRVSDLFSGVTLRHVTLLTQWPWGHPLIVWVLLGSKILVKAVGPAVGYMAPGGAFIEDATNQVHNRNERERWGWGCS